MDLRKGYKQTEFGIIPEDWQLAPLPNLCWFQEGPGLRNWQFTSSGMKIINVTNLEGGVLNLARTDRHISISLFNRMYRHFAIDACDIVMASSGNSYSKTAIVRKQDLPLVMNTSVIRFKPSRLCSFGYLWAILRSPKFKEQIDLMITGGAQPNFGPYHLKRMVFPLPTLTEQEAISEALSDADAWIESLEQLIAKKRQLKLGAMQELLTGKRRLPGFSGKWKVYRFDQLFSLIRNASCSRADLSTEGDVAYVHYGDIHIHPNAFMNPFELGTCISFEKARGVPRLIDGDLLMADASEDTSAIGKAVELFGLSGREAIAGLHTLALRGDKKYLADGFKGFIQHLPGVHDALVSLATGVSVYGITKTGVKAIEVKLPATEEQVALAKVLSEMDAEIAVLESVLSKARLIKLSMMQELLTGHIRLVNPKRGARQC